METPRSMALINFSDLTVIDIGHCRFGEKSRAATTLYSRDRQQRHQKAKFTCKRRDGDSLVYGKLTFAINSHPTNAMLTRDSERLACNLEVASMPTAATTIGLDYLEAKTSAFVRAIYRLCRAEVTEDDAIDLVYDRLAAMLAEQELDACDDILESLDEKKVTPAVIASVLTITAGAKSVLAERSDFYNRAREHLVKIRGAISTERLLVGLA